MDVMKTCDGNNQFSSDQALPKKDDEEKCTANAAESFFQCRICLEVARDPVVTCCGHLFCWPCIYRWLNDTKECPVCKGEVIVKSVTPINGRRENTCEPETNSSLKIPLRPQARREESLRRALERATFIVPMEVMIRCLGHKFDLPPIHPHQENNITLRTNAVLNQILTSRGMRREEDNIISPNDVVHLVPSSPTNTELGESSRNSSLLPRSNSNQAATISPFTSAISTEEKFTESDFPNNPVDRNAEMPFPADDGDDFFSTADRMLSEVQTPDSVDPVVSVFASSSRRRVHASTISGVDSGYSYASRRRRRLG